MASLEAQAWRGGVAMAARQVLGMAISFAGLIALARLIGTEAYGVYVSAFGLHAYLTLLFQWGTDVFLIRKPEDPTPEDAHQAFTLSMVLGGTGALLGLPIGWAAEAWIGAEGIGMAVATLVAGLPLTLMAQVPSALLQRRMAYGRVAWAELAGQGALYGVAVAAAAAGLDLAAPLVGWWAQQVVMAALFFGFSGYRPRLVWRREVLARLVSYGLGYAASIWVWHLRTLANPLIVAKALGPEAAASVAVAQRLAEALSFMRIVVWRVALPFLGRIQNDPARMARAVTMGMRLQVLAVGPLMAIFALLAPWLVPLAFGKDWTPVVAIFPFLALAHLANSTFSLHGSALYALGRNGQVTAFHLAHVAVLFTVAALLVPRLGLMGFGLAEMAALGGYALLHILTARALGRLEVGLGLVWGVGFGLPLFANLLGPAAWAGPVVVLALPATWRAVADWWSQIKEFAHG